MTDTILKAEGLMKRYGSHMALMGLDLELPRGKIIGILGPNGSGKTTFLKLAAGLLTPTSGTITRIVPKVLRALAGTDSNAYSISLPPACVAFLFSVAIEFFSSLFLLVELLNYISFCLKIQAKFCYFAQFVTFHNIVLFVDYLILDHPPQCCGLISLTRFLGCAMIV